jgi:hypothetical protein
VSADGQVPEPVTVAQAREILLEDGQGVDHDCAVGVHFDDCDYRCTCPCHTSPDTLREFAEWLIALDEPNRSLMRRSMSLEFIIERAREVLALSPQHHVDIPRMSAAEIREPSATTEEKRDG